MKRFTNFVKRNWWPISAMIFCPCHLPLSIGGLLAITAGTSVGAYLTAHYASIESTLAVLFSFYFVVAFLIWALRGPRAAEGAACSINTDGTARPAGFSVKQILGWGLGSALIMPTLVLAGVIVRDDLPGKIVAGARDFDMSNSGFIWLISISTIVMIPVMVVWIAWMWVMWSRVDESDEPEKWEYEYEYE